MESLSSRPMPYDFQAVIYEGLIAVVMKSSVFWDITPRSLQKMNRGFERTFHLHLHGRKINLAINQHEVSNKLCFMPVFYLAYYSAPTMEATSSSEHIR
jgi:hypothetical protein